MSTVNKGLSSLLDYKGKFKNFKSDGDTGKSKKQLQHTVTRVIMKVCPRHVGGLQGGNQLFWQRH